MHEQIASQASAQPAYRIGAAARLTGISTHTLRKWEDRYGLVEPRRSAGGERLYSASDVKRLALVKDLAGSGMSLADLAALSLTDLEQLFRESHESPPEHVSGAPIPGRVTLAVAGAALPMLIAQESNTLRHSRIVATGDSMTQVSASLGDEQPDVLLLECPAVTSATARELSQAMADVGAQAAVVVYGFGARPDLDALRRPEVALVRAPADAAEIERLCLGLVVSLSQHWPAPAVQRPLADDTVVPQRRWSRETLARVAGIASTVACECPRHLADLIMSLDSFEAYSAACENRDDKDAALHAYLRITAATSRALFEDALERVAAHEGIDLE